MRHPFRSTFTKPVGSFLDLVFVQSLVIVEGVYVGVLNRVEILMERCLLVIGK